MLSQQEQKIDEEEVVEIAKPKTATKDVQSQEAPAVVAAEVLPEVE